MLRSPLAAWLAILTITGASGFEAEGPDSAAAMEHARTWIWFWGGGLAFVLIIAWPCLALPAGIFSEGYYTFYVILSIIWGLVRNSCQLVSFPCLLFIRDPDLVSGNYIGDVWNRLLPAVWRWYFCCLSYKANFGALAFCISTISHPVLLPSPKSLLSPCRLQR